MADVKFGGAKYKLSMFGTPQPKELVGKCPRCCRVYTLVFVNALDQYGHHIYRCGYCGAAVASPTEFGRCEIYGVLAKDTFWSPCAKCPQRKSLPEHIYREKGVSPGVCVHFRGPVNPAEVT